MSDVIQIERFTRQNQSVSGSFRPQDLPRLVDFLAGADGEITYVLSGSRTTDLLGSQKHCLKCIISGWFLLADPVTTKPLRHDCEIESKLVLVGNETELPPLEMESDEEDYIVVGSELNVLERIEEEILLDLPAAYGGMNLQVESTGKPKKATKSLAAVTDAGTTNGIVSPFAKLAELKKK